MSQMITKSFALTLHINASELLESNPDRAILFQLLLRPRDGGIGFPDPVAIAPAAFLGSFADTLPPLREDKFLGPYLKDPRS